MECRLIIIFTLLVATIGIVDAGTAEDFFRNRETSNVKMSPDGKYLSALVRTKKTPGAKNLVLIDLATMNSEAITGYKDADIFWYYWAGNDRIVFTLTTDVDAPFQRYFNLGVFSIGLDGKSVRNLYGSGVAVIKYQLEGLNSLPNDDDHILVQRRGNYPTFPDVYRMNTNSGKLKKIVRNKNDVLTWIADNNGVVRVGISVGHVIEDLKYELIYRSDDDSPWRTLFEIYDDTLVVFGFDETNSRLFVAARLNGGRYKLYAMDPESGQLGEPILEDPDYDIYYEYSNTPHLVTTDQGKPVYFEYMRDRPRRIFFDAKWRMRQKTIDQTLPGTENRMVSWDRDETRFLIFRYSDRDEGSYYLYDEREKSIRFLLAISPWLDSENFASTESFEYEARDGLKLHGYITRKTSDSEGPAPTIILPHGGPWGVRDQWGFDSEIQFLASLGYTVIQPNFRGSGGYGYNFQAYSYRQLGLIMQDDVTDATHWAIENKIADPQRICIYGAGFGAYAALMGVAKKPGLYACAICIAGIYDLEYLARRYVRSGRRKGFGRFKAWREAAFGDYKKDAERLRNTSPVNLVPQIKAPVFIIGGIVERPGNMTTPANLGPQIKKPAFISGGIGARTGMPRTGTLSREVMIIGQLKRHKKIYRFLDREYGRVGLLAEQSRIDRYTEISDFLGTYLNDEQ